MDNRKGTELIKKEGDTRSQALKLFDEAVRNILDKYVEQRHSLHIGL